MVTRSLPGNQHQHHLPAPYFHLHTLLLFGPFTPFLHEQWRFDGVPYLTPNVLYRPVESPRRLVYTHGFRHSCVVLLLCAAHGRPFSSKCVFLCVIRCATPLGCNEQEPGAEPLMLDRFDARWMLDLPDFKKGTTSSLPAKLASEVRCLFFCDATIYPRCRGI